MQKRRNSTYSMVSGLFTICILLNKVKYSTDLQTMIMLCATHQ